MLKSTDKEKRNSVKLLCYFDPQEKFGKDIEITDKKRKVGTKRLSEYGSDVGTDDLANDSDLDVSTRELASIECKVGDDLMSDRIWINLKYAALLVVGYTWNLIKLI